MSGLPASIHRPCHRLLQVQQPLQRIEAFQNRGAVPLGHNDLDGLAPLRSVPKSPGNDFIRAVQAQLAIGIVGPFGSL